MKRLFSFLMAVVLLVSISSTAVAVGAGHTCTYRTWISYEYTPYSNTMHLAKTIKHYKCTDPNCSIEYSEVIVQQYESHHNVMVWTGEHYHSGSLHHCYYAPKCTSCKHMNYNGGEWRAYACPGGNGNPCILPESVPIPHEIQ